jgi:large subunit ribosomal protein L19
MDIAALVDIKKNPNIPTLSPGDTVKVFTKVIEGERERIQVFQGVVIKVQEGATGNFTVRRVAYGSGTERTFPFNSPLVNKVEVIRHGKVRRAKLFYLRGLTTKKARLKEKRVIVKPEVEAVEETTLAAEAAPVNANEATMASAPAVSAQSVTPQTEAPKAETEQPKPESETK